MKNKDYKQSLRDISIEDLKAKVREHKQESLKLRFQTVLASTKSHAAKLLRRNTARVLTELAARGVSLPKLSRSKSK